MLDALVNVFLSLFCSIWLNLEREEEEAMAVLGPKSLCSGMQLCVPLLCVCVCVCAVQGQDGRLKMITCTCSLRVVPGQPAQLILDEGQVEDIAWNIMQSSSSIMRQTAKQSKAKQSKAALASSRIPSRIGAMAWRRGRPLLQTW